MKEICTLKTMKYFSRMSRNKVIETLPLVKQRKTRYKTNNNFFFKKSFGKKKLDSTQTVEDCIPDKRRFTVKAGICSQELHNKSAMHLHNFVTEH
jgi:hypothetical protein